MRRRIISLTVLAALVSTVLFALPLGIAATRYYRDDTTTELERAADTVALAVSHALDAGLPPEVPPPGDEDDADREVGVYSPDGRLLAGHGPAAAGSIEQQAASATMDVVTGNEGDDLVLAVPVLSGSKVTGVVRAAMPSSTLTVRIALTLHGMALLAAAAIGASWLLARRFAKRLVRPLEELA
ncbi:sensor histidine kinase, partial [Amycolatopsis mediterranei]